MSWQVLYVIQSSRISMRKSNERFEILEKHLRGDCQNASACVGFSDSLSLCVVFFSTSERWNSCVRYALNLMKQSKIWSVYFKSKLTFYLSCVFWNALTCNLKECVWHFKYVCIHLILRISWVSIVKWTAYDWRLLFLGRRTLHAKRKHSVGDAIAF